MKPELSPEKLALLVLRAQRKRQAEPAAAPDRIPRRGATGPAPLSFAQQRLWLLDQLEPGSTAYNMAFPLRLRGGLDVARLAAAWGEVVRRHEALRTTFRAVDGVPVQVVAPPRPGPFPLFLADLSGLPGPARDGEAERLVARQLLRPFDLERGPLVRGAVLRLGEGEQVLFGDLHHIIADGWSISVFCRELSALYGAGAEAPRDTPSPLPTPPIQLADFAVWQRERLTGAVLAEQLGYWRRRLAGVPPVLELPTDRLRPPVQTHRGGFAGHTLPPDLADRLRQLARREGASLFMPLLAGFDLLLGRLAGQDDVVVGSPSAGRDRVELEGLIGLFLNTLVLRADLAGDPSFRQLLDRVKDDVLGAYQHQELPFEALIEALQPERLLDRTPIFQVLFNYVSLPDMRLALPGVEALGLKAGDVESKFDLTLYLEDTSGPIELQLVYNALLFDPERMEEMLRQLAAVLAQVVADPAAADIRIGSLSLVTAAAAALLPDPHLSLSDAWHGPTHRQLSRHAAAEPERLAVADESGEAWAYGELEARSNQLARHLLVNGVGRGDAVAVWAHRGASLAWALLGIHKAGAAFLVLDPTYPAARLQQYLRIARPAGWLEVAGAPDPPEEVVAEMAERTATCRCRLVLPHRSIAARNGFLAALPATDPEVPVGPDDAACLTFTSGSTGTPKAVVGRHGPLTHFHPWLGERFGLSGDDCFGLLSALAHDPLQRDVLTPLWFGAAIAVPDPLKIDRPGYLAGWARRTAVTVLNLTPAMLDLLCASAEDAANAANAADPAVAELPDLRRAFVVGDLLKRSDVERLQRLAPALLCVNLYGATETQRALSSFAVPRPGTPEAARLGREVLPLGQGMAGCQLLVRSGAGGIGGLGGIGELGEIYFRSPHLSRGYLGDPALTAERFLPDGNGERLYRTGDLGRYLPTGGVEFVGRADHQVQLRGFRIEPGEVEAALARHPAVQECVVVVREKRLVAYFVATGGAGGMPPRPAELAAFLAARLPAHMVPAVFVALPELPLTPNRKVDRRALPAPGPVGREASAGADHDPHSSLHPITELLGALWAGLLGVERVEPEDHFFALGGQSLLAARVVARVRSVLGVEVPARALFEAPTLAGFAARVERAQREETRLDLPPPPVRVPRDGPLPLSFSQQRLWLLDQIEPGSFAYNLAGAVRLGGSLDVAALGQVLTEIVRRHESLRTRFAADAMGDPEQVVAAPAPCPLPLVDLAGLPEAVREAAARRLAHEEARRPFDLARGPLLRLALLRLGGEEHALLVSLHHTVSDGWSVGLFVRELGMLYRAFVAREASPLAELPVQYGDYAVWQRRWLAGPVLEAQLAYWTARLAGAPPLLELPTDHPRPALRSYRGAAVALPLDSALGAALHGLALRLAATPFMLLAGGFAALLARYSGQEDVVLGTPIANRPHAELEELIGFFANTLCLRTDLTGAPDLAQLVGRVRETALGAYAHQDLPFERLVEALRPERDLRHSPVFQVMLTLQNLPRMALELPGLTLSSFEVDGGRAQFDLTLTLYPGPDSGLFARLDYALDLFDTATASRLLAHLQNLLAAMAAHPEARIAELPLLAPEERQELLAAGNDTAAPVPDASVASLFAAVAASQPDAVAVTQERESLSYGELAARSNRLAHHLRRQGVGAEVRPEMRIAVCVERSPALLVALLGVLQAGGVYVPLDPSYPVDRLAWIVADSGAALLLTTSDFRAALPPLPEEMGVITLDALDVADGRRVPPPWEGEGWDRGEARRGAPPSPDSLSYVIYTSGSTGRPKGVAIASCGMVNFLASMARRPGLDATDVLVAVTTIAFDIAVLELFLPLVVGARVELADRETASDGQRLAARLAACGATVLQATPSTWRLLLEAGWEGAPHLTALCGGEALPPELARALAARTRALWNVYGPTETTVWSAVHPVAAADLEGRPIPLGVPIANTALHLLGRFEHGLQPVPPGVVGELYLGGAGLARGYLGRPDLTAERFVPNPFATSPGARLYRTGDLVRRRSPQGELEILGRVDRQVKLRGFRIELGEIEAVLGGDPAVRQCAVVVREDGGVRRLVAYLALHDGSGGLGSLDAVLRGKLPDYMVPHLLVALPELPLTPNGKLDRRALLALPAPEGAAAAEHVAPRNPAEALLAAVWAEVLRLDRVSVHANFFTLGGDSILAMRAVTRSRARGLRFTPRQLFQNQTVAQLAAVAEVAVEPSAEPVPVPTAELPLAHLAPADLADVLAELGDE